jgi:FixJ family two-component response regulator
MDSVGLNATAFDSARDFLAVYDGGHAVLVLDVRMPAMSGLELQEELNARGITALKIIFISGHGDIEMAVEALKRGATDFLSKPFRDQELLDRVHKALEDSNVELERSATAADGKANKVIAMDLDISQRTVEIHRAHVMEKMGVGSLAQLIRQLHRADYFER